MPIINSILSWIIRKRIHQIELFVKYPHDVQNDWRTRLIEKAKDTEWGKKYEYASIKSVDEYRNRVPIQDYEKFQPTIERLMHGEQNLLWPSDILWFAKSSGTTGSKSKFIPVSQDALEECHFKGGKDMLALYCHNNQEAMIFDGKNLTLGGSHQPNALNNNSQFGDISAVILQNLPVWVQLIRTPEISVALMDKWEEKIDRIARITMNENIVSMSGVPTWIIVLINRILEISGKNNLLEVWPNLELFIHGGVSFAPYRKHFQEIIPSSKMNYVETYNASEGFFGIQDRLGSEDMLLMLDYGVFYEFLPLSELGKSDPKTKLLHEVSIDIDYALVITTNAGLWRYMIGDTIRFTSLSPFRIRVTGRTKHFINAFGEEMIIDNAEQALTIACEKTDAKIKEYTVAPIFFKGKENAAHEWLIEFEREPLSMEYFSELLDNALKSLNSDYEAKRYHDMALRPPLLRIMPKNTFYEWMKSKNKLGGQHKVPRLSNDRKYVDELLEFIQQSGLKSNQNS